MADYADNYTARYVLRYLCGGQVHNQQWRMGSALTAGAAAAAIHKITDIWEPAAGFMSNDLAFLGAKFYPMNSDVGLPAILPDGINDLAASGVMDASSGPRYLSIPWLTQVGGKQTTFFYGTIVNPVDVNGKNYRYELGELAGTDAMITALAAGIILMTGNDRQPGLAVQSYVNHGVNPALVRRRRRG